MSTTSLLMFNRLKSFNTEPYHDLNDFAVVII
jgi:hypothetical protein